MASPLRTLLPAAEPADEETFEYACRTCGEEFELPKDQMFQVRCPSCSSASVADANSVE